MALKRSRLSPGLRYPKRATTDAVRIQSQLKVMANGSLAEAAHSKRLSAALCRHGFQHVQQTVSQLIHILRSKGPDEVVDMDHAALRVTLDVIGQVGFGKDFGATKSLDATDTANAAFATMEAGLAFWNSLAALSRPGCLSFARQDCRILNRHDASQCTCLAWGPGDS